MRWLNYSYDYSSRDDFRDLELIKRSGGSDAILARIKNFDIANHVGQSNDTSLRFNLRVDVTNNGIIIKINDNIISELSYSDQPELKHVGLWTDDNDKDIAYDNLIILTP